MCPLFLPFSIFFSLSHPARACVVRGTRRPSPVDIIELSSLVGDTSQHAGRYLPPESHHRRRYDRRVVADDAATSVKLGYTRQLCHTLGEAVQGTGGRQLDITRGSCTVLIGERVSLRVDTRFMKGRRERARAAEFYVQAVMCFVEPCAKTIGTMTYTCRQATDYNVSTSILNLRARPP